MLGSFDFDAPPEVKAELAAKSFSFRWYEGNCPFFNYRTIDSPQGGTQLSHEDIVKLELDFSGGMNQPA